MAYSFEGISTHPNLKIKPETSYIDIYGPPCTEINNEEGLDRAFSIIKNRKPLPTSISKRSDWSIASIMSTLE